MARAGLADAPAHGVGIFGGGGFCGGDGGWGHVSASLTNDADHDDGFMKRFGQIGFVGAGGAAVGGDFGHGLEKGHECLGAQGGGEQVFRHRFTRDDAVFAGAALDDVFLRHEADHIAFVAENEPAHGVGVTRCVVFEIERAIGSAEIGDGALCDDGVFE